MDISILYCVCVCVCVCACVQRELNESRAGEETLRHHLHETQTKLAKVQEEGLYI